MGLSHGHKHPGKNNKGMGKKEKKIKAKTHHAYPHKNNNTPYFSNHQELRLHEQLSET